MSDLMPYNKLSTQAIALVFADYVHAVCKRGDEREDEAWDNYKPIEEVAAVTFEFQIPRDVLIAELERMSAWLSENHSVYQSMNGGR